MENHSTKQHSTKQQNAPTIDTFGKKSERQRQKEKAAAPKKLQFEKKGTHIKFEDKEETDVKME